MKILTKKDLDDIGQRLLWMQEALSRNISNIDCWDYGHFCNHLEHILSVIDYKKEE